MAKFAVGFGTTKVWLNSCSMLTSRNYGRKSLQVDPLHDDKNKKNAQDDGQEKNDAAMEERDQAKMVCF